MLEVRSSPQHRSPWFDTECREIKRERERDRERDRQRDGQRNRKECPFDISKNQKIQMILLCRRKRKIHKQHNDLIGVLLDSMNNPISEEFWGEMRVY